MYSKFMEHYYKMIKDLLDFGSTDLQIIYEEHKQMRNFIASYNKSCELGVIYFSDICSKYSNYEHHPIIPMIIKDVNKNLSIRDIKKKFKENDKIYEKFINSIETQKVLKGYRWITGPEIDEIYEKYNRSNNEQSDSNDSDEEEFD